VEFARLARLACRPHVENVPRATTFLIVGATSLAPILTFAPAAVAQQQLTCEELQAACHLFEHLTQENDADEDGCPDSLDEDSRDPHVSCESASYCDGPECGEATYDPTEERTPQPPPENPPPDDGNPPTEPTAPSDVEAEAHPRVRMDAPSFEIVGSFAEMGYLAGFRVRGPRGQAGRILTSSVAGDQAIVLGHEYAPGEYYGYCLDREGKSSHPPDQWTPYVGTMQFDRRWVGRSPSLCTTLDVWASQGDASSAELAAVCGY
jgi:hypothetical protein